MFKCYLASLFPTSMITRQEKKMTTAQPIICKIVMDCPRKIHAKAADVIGRKFENIPKGVGPRFRRAIGMAM